MKQNPKDYITSPKIDFGFGNLELFLRTNYIDDTLVHCFVGVHGSYCISSSNKSMNKKLLNNKFARNYTIKHIKNIGTQALKKYIKNKNVFSSNFSEHLSSFEKFFLSELNSNEELKALGIYISFLTVDGFYIRDENEPLTQIDPNSIQKISSFFVALLVSLITIATILFIFLLPKNNSINNINSSISDTLNIPIFETISPESTTFIHNIETIESTVESFLQTTSSVIDTTNIDTTNIDTTNIDTTNIDTTHKTTSYLETETTNVITQTTTKETTRIETIPITYLPHYTIATTQFYTSQTIPYTTNETINTTSIIQPETTNQPSTTYTETTNSIYILNQVYGDFEYNVIKSRVVITHYNGNSSIVSIPEYINNYPVTTIGEYSFYLNENITSINLSNNIDNISTRAFYGCSSLNSVNISPYSNLKIIEPYAFAYCNLKTIDLSNAHNLVFIRNNAFEYNYSNRVCLPEKVLEIGDNAFVGGEIKYVKNNSKLPINCSSSDYGQLGVNAFVVEDSTGNYYFPNDGYNYHITSDNYIFKELNNKYNLVSYFGNNSTLFLPNNINGQLYEISCFLEGTNIILPDSFTVLNDSAFNGNQQIKTITLPNTLTRIGSNAFMNSSLEEIIIPEGVTSIGESAFFYCKKLKSISFPSTLDEILPTCLIGCDNLTQITINNPKYSSVNGCIIEKETKTLIRGTKNCIIPNDGSVTTIGFMAFADSENIKEMVIPHSITKIDSFAFINCMLLNEVVIPNSIIEIGDGAFSSCGNVKIIFEKDSKIETIGAEAFVGILEKVYLYDKNNEYLVTYLDAYNIQIIIIE